MSQSLSIKNSFDKDASGAVLDFLNDDSSKDNQRRRKWDRKKKKFVTESGEENKKKKMIQTESGNWISSSYRSNAYADWQNRSKRGSLIDQDGENDGRRNKKDNVKGFKVVGLSNRNRHTGGKDGDDKGSKQKFKKREMKTKDQILKNRKQKAKVQNFQKYRENIRTKRKEKGGGGGKGGKGKRK